METLKTFFLESLYMNSIELSKKSHGTNEPHKLKLRLLEDMKLPEQIALGSISIWHNWKNISSKLGDYSFKIQINRIRGEENEKFYSDHYLNYIENNNFMKIPDGSYSVTDLNYFIHLQIKRIEKRSDEDRNFGINLYANPTYNRITIEIDPIYTLILSDDLSKLLGSEDKEIRAISKNFENAPIIENVEEIRVHCDLVRNKFQPELNLLYSFSPSSPIGKDETPKIYFPIWKLTRSSTVREINVWLTNQDNQPLDFEDNWLVSILLRG